MVAGLSVAVNVAVTPVVSSAVKAAFLPSLASSQRNMPDAATSWIMPSCTVHVAIDWSATTLPLMPVQLPDWVVGLNVISPTWGVRVSVSAEPAMMADRVATLYDSGVVTGWGMTAMI